MPTSSPLRLSRLCQASLLALAAVSVQAQEAQKLDRVEVTGSSIKRIDGETPLLIMLAGHERALKTNYEHSSSRS